MLNIIPVSLLLPHILPIFVKTVGEYEGFVSRLSSCPDKNGCPMAQAQLSPSMALERLFTAPAVEREWFTDSFLNQIPVPPEQIIRDIQGQLGAFQVVQAEGDRYRLLFEWGSLQAAIALNPQGQITGLLFQNLQTNGISVSEAIAQLQALPGQVNLLVLETSTETPVELAALNADQPLAVGSTFKLAVLAALRQEIEAGQRNWGDVVALEAADRSLPSGILQTWFDGALLTVESLATLMISQSDNTATDRLIRLVGREAIEPLAPRNQPFLTTREAFVLKAPQNATLLQQYREGTAAQRRQLLADIAQTPLPAVTDIPDQPTTLDVEWVFTPRELCALMGQVSALPLMQVNPGGGLVNPDDWAQVAFKGGSEAGVLNLTTELVSKDGKRYCVSATWNNPDAPLDEGRFFTLYSGLMAGL